MKTNSDSFVNHQLKLAADYVQYTNKNIFLTGKAGTGKTTFLHNLRKDSAKRIVVVAPTGVAAINAGGVTIHSFFQIPFGPYIPQHLQGDKLSFNPGARNENEKRKFNRDKINLIQSLDLLVIDEISMVRADVLDAIDEVLRRYRRYNQPFGGVQLLMIGDLHQLAPVIKDDEWRMLSEYYQTGYFFGSLALRQAPPVCIELKHIYRQSDTHFIKILNSIRDNNISSDLLQELNTRYIPGFRPEPDEGYITLTTHNNSARKINQKHLAEIDSKSHQFKADIRNDFPEYAYPTDASLELKVGAQVMFVKNDSSKDKLYFNGKIGRITSISEGTVYVKSDDNYNEIAVSPEEWKNIRYSLNTESKSIEEDVIGSFRQYPLKTAWAITIHKSQGLTFEKAIIDANASFAHGQVYVALSRCKTFEGMVLSTPIGSHSIKTDPTVAAFSQTMIGDDEDDAPLQKAKTEFQQQLLRDLFDFSDIEKELLYCRKLVQEHTKSLLSEVVETLTALPLKFETEIAEVGRKFAMQTNTLLQNDALPENNTALQERVARASGYFAEKLDTAFMEPAKQLSADTDNKLLRETITEAFGDLQRALFVKIACLKASMQGIDTARYLKTRADADIDFRPIIKSRATGGEFGIRSMKHAALYHTIRQWRDSAADEAGLPPYMLLPQKVLLEIVKTLPVTLTELNAIKGLGKKKINSFGSLLIEMVRQYCHEQGIEKNVQESLVNAEDSSPKKKKKGESHHLSLELFKSGLSPESIATQRNLALTTIEGHLSTFIESGELALHELLTTEASAPIEAILLSHPEASLSELKVLLGDSVSFGAIRMVRSHLQYIQKVEPAT